MRLQVSSLLKFCLLHFLRKTNSKNLDFQSSDAKFFCPQEPTDRYIHHGKSNHVCFLSTKHGIMEQVTIKNYCKKNWMELQSQPHYPSTSTQLKISMNEGC